MRKLQVNPLCPPECGNKGAPDEDGFDTLCSAAATSDNIWNEILRHFPNLIDLVVGPRPGVEGCDRPSLKLRPSTAQNFRGCAWNVISMVTDVHKRLCLESFLLRSQALIEASDEDFEAPFWLEVKCNRSDFQDGRLSINQLVAKLRMVHTVEDSKQPDEFVDLNDADAPLIYMYIDKF
ncbi:hypothetical protein HDU88_002379 [Geranomyces variabilis]|nr:hypothetical protein HDU88_002379 [Geranomyces variabilis]